MVDIRNLKIELLDHPLLHQFTLHEDCFKVYANGENQIYLDLERFPGIDTTKLHQKDLETLVLASCSLINGRASSYGANNLTMIYKFVDKEIDNVL